MPSRAEGKSAEVRGSQEPRICTVPDYHSSAGDEAVEVAALAGLHLDPWQQFVLRHSLGERKDGKWAAPTVGLVCSRQNGKNSILEARELAGLFLLGERVIVHSAHEQATASEQFRRLSGLIQAVPEFERRMLREIKGKGSEAIELRGGQRILFKTRTGGGARGFSIDCIVFDEAYELPETAISAMVPTLAARPNTQTWYTSSAVDQQKHANGMALARQRERGVARKPGIAYFEWSCEGDDPSRVDPKVFDEPRSWSIANPSLGHRLGIEAVQAEHDGSMGAREFAVERLGIGDWPSSDPDAGRVITVAQWSALLDRESVMACAGCIAFDAAPDRSWATITGAGYREDGKVHVGVIDRRPRMGWVPEAVAALVKELRPQSVIADAAGPVAALLPELEELGVEITLTSSKEYAQACMMLAEAVDNSALAHRGEPELAVAIDGAATLPLADGWKWSRRRSGVSDISPLVAVTLAHWGCITADPQYATLITFDPEPSPELVGARGPHLLSQAETTARALACQHRPIDGCTCPRRAA